MLGGAGVFTATPGSCLLYMKPEKMERLGEKNCKDAACPNPSKVRRKGRTKKENVDGPVPEEVCTPRCALAVR